MIHLLSLLHTKQNLTRISKMIKKITKKQENILAIIFKEISHKRTIGIFDIGKVFNAGRRAFMIGNDPVEAMKLTFNQYECSSDDLMTLSSI